jgi:non-ribosomal peptide synthetase component F
MTLAELFARLRQHGIRVSADDGQLVIKGAAASLTPEVRAALAARKGEILRFLDDAAKLARHEQPPLEAVSRSGKLPLSFAQQRLWFLDQYEPNGAVYNLPSVRRLKGTVNVAALEASLNEIIRRHESLRTTFSLVENEPVQVIAPSLIISLDATDLRDYRAEQREEKARRLVREEAERPFDLSRGPLFRCKLLRLGKEEYILLLALHHIVSDGWSMGVLYRELAALYRAFVTGETSPLANLPVQYADFAVWQRKWLQGESLSRRLSYWKEQLAGIPKVLNLRTDRPRRPVQSYNGAHQSIQLSGEISDGLRALSRQQDATLFMTLLAAFQILLHRWTGQEDIVVGTPIANRNRSEIEGLIGFFVNNLVLRSDFSDDPTFKELLARVKETTLNAYAHQDLPFERLVEELHPERSSNHAPLFQVFFNMVNLDNLNLELHGLTLESYPLATFHSKFDMTLYIRDDGRQLSLRLAYKPELFDEPRMSCFLQQYRHLVDQLVADPARPVGMYSLLAPESQAMLPDPASELSEPEQRVISETFLLRAREFPAQPAVKQGDRIWTYEQLARSADALARVLMANGLAPGDVVAVHGQASFGFIAAMIAAFLSGGVLLTLDAALPPGRKQRMLGVARAKQLFHVGAKQTEDAWLEEEFGQRMLFIDPQSGSTAAAEALPGLDSLALPEVSPLAPAYIFFTSGTTGIPKAILGCHKGLSHFLNWQRSAFAIGPGDRVAQLTALSFDAVLRDIFLALTSGATLCLRDCDEPPSSGGITAWLEREKISVMHAVPSLAQSWLLHGDRKHDLHSMRWVFSWASR